MTKYGMEFCNIIHMWLRHSGDGRHVGFLEDFEEEEEKGWLSHVTTAKLNLASFMASQFCESSTS